MGPAARTEELGALAARAATGSLRAAASRAGSGAAAAGFEECVRGLEAEKAKMEVFRRELPISVRLVADAIEWLKGELAQHRPPAPEPFAKRKAAPEADDKRSWMSSAQLWSCGTHDDNTGNGVANDPARKVSNASVPLNGLPALARSADVAEEPAATPVPELSLSSSPAIDGAGPAAPSAASSAVTDARGAQRKARRCWSPELHRRFVAALQRLGGAQAATPKQIRELMKVDGLTNDEVKSHLQKYRLHTRRASSDGGDQQAAVALWSAPERQQQQYAASQHSTSQSGSPQGPLQLAVSSRAVSVTGGDSCDGGDEEDGKSESYSWEMQQLGTKSSSS